MTLSALRYALDQCRYRLDEARDEHDLRDRVHHNAGVDAAEHCVVQLLRLEEPTGTTTDRSFKDALIAGSR
jgi:hypothetical protein